MQGVRKPAVVDLFCGAGGLSYGMLLSGIEIAAGIDADPACRHPYSENVRSAFHEQGHSDRSARIYRLLVPGELCPRIGRMRTLPTLLTIHEQANR